MPMGLLKFYKRYLDVVHRKKKVKIAFIIQRDGMFAKKLTQQGLTPLSNVGNNSRVQKNVKLKPRYKLECFCPNNTVVDYTKLFVRIISVVKN